MEPWLPRASVEENEKSVLNGDTVSARDDEKVPEMVSGGDRTAG